MTVLHAAADRTDVRDRCGRRQFGDQPRQLSWGLRVVPQHAKETLTQLLLDPFDGPLISVRAGARQLVAVGLEFTLRVLVHATSPQPLAESQLGLLPRLRHHQPGQSCHRRRRKRRQSGFR
ncbi:hypothetical protein OG787_06790 [Streptomyces sp. NBC_00075]|uniref:hypothetical protein n=1 Tax=Streptomyces sp. NBC_00075 TaxID=2975641 RepID=UPI0032544D56